MRIRIHNTGHKCVNTPLKIQDEVYYGTTLKPILMLVGNEKEGVLGK
jgi:hypothetical protein